MGDRPIPGEHRQTQRHHQRPQPPRRPRIHRPPPRPGHHREPGNGEGSQGAAATMKPTRLCEVTRTKRSTQPMNLSWNRLHVQSRKEFCRGACISEKLADKSWQELDKWLQVLLAYSLKLRTRGNVKLCA